MPLRSGSSKATRDANIRTLMGEVGKSPHVQSREQALAIAYAKQREGRWRGGNVGYAEGGIVRHDQDPDLPSAQDHAELVPQTEGRGGYPPAYLETIERLMQNQRRLQGLDRRLPGIDRPRAAPYREGGEVTNPNFFYRPDREREAPRPQTIKPQPWPFPNLRRRRFGGSIDGIEEVHDGASKGWGRYARGGHIRYLDDGGGSDGGGTGGGQGGGEGSACGGSGCAGCGCTGDACGGGACGACSCGAAGGCGSCGVAGSATGAGCSDSGAGGGSGCSGSASAEGTTGETGVGGCMAAAMGAALGATTGQTGQTGEEGGRGGPTGMGLGYTGQTGQTGQTGLGFGPGAVAGNPGAVGYQGAVAGGWSGYFGGCVAGLTGAAQAASFDAYAGACSYQGGQFGPGAIGDPNATGQPGTNSFGAESTAGGGGTNGLGAAAGSWGGPGAGFGGTSGYASSGIGDVTPGGGRGGGEDDQGGGRGGGRGGGAPAASPGAAQGVQGEAAGIGLAGETGGVIGGTSEPGTGGEPSGGPSTVGGNIGAGPTGGPESALGAAAVAENESNLGLTDEQSGGKSVGGKGGTTTTGTIAGAAPAAPATGSFTGQVGDVSVSPATAENTTGLGGGTYGSAPGAGMGPGLGDIGGLSFGPGNAFGDPSYGMPATQDIGQPTQGGRSGGLSGGLPGATPTGAFANALSGTPTPGAVTALGAQQSLSTQASPGGFTPGGLGGGLTSQGMTGTTATGFDAIGNTSLTGGPLGGFQGSVAPAGMSLDPIGAPPGAFGPAETFGPSDRGGGRAGGLGPGNAAGIGLSNAISDRGTAVGDRASSLGLVGGSYAAPYGGAQGDRTSNLGLVGEPYASPSARGDRGSSIGLAGASYAAPYGGAIGDRASSLGVTTGQGDRSGERGGLGPAAGEAAPLGGAPQAEQSLAAPSVPGGWQGGLYGSQTENTMDVLGAPVTPGNIGGIEFGPGNPFGDPNYGLPATEDIGQPAQGGRSGAVPGGSWADQTFGSLANFGGLTGSRGTTGVANSNIGFGPAGVQGDLTGGRDATLGWGAPSGLASVAQGNLGAPMESVVAPATPAVDVDRGGKGDRDTSPDRGGGRSGGLEGPSFASNIGNTIASALGISPAAAQELGAQAQAQAGPQADARSAAAAATGQTDQAIANAINNAVTQATDFTALEAAGRGAGRGAADPIGSALSTLGSWATSPTGLGGWLGTPASAATPAPGERGGGPTYGPQSDPSLGPTTPATPDPGFEAPQSERSAVTNTPLGDIQQTAENYAATTQSMTNQSPALTGGNLGYDIGTNYGNVTPGGIDVDRGSKGDRDTGPQLGPGVTESEPSGLGGRSDRGSGVQASPSTDFGGLSAYSYGDEPMGLNTLGIDRSGTQYGIKTGGSVYFDNGGIVGSSIKRFVDVSPSAAAGQVDQNPMIGDGLARTFSPPQLGFMFSEIGHNRRDQNPPTDDEDSNKPQATVQLQTQGQQPSPFAPAFGFGGYVDQPGFYAAGGLSPASMRSFASQAHYSGANMKPAINPPGVHLISSDVPGRTDRIPMRARPGSYVLPADVVSGLGQGNTMAGAKMWGQMLAASAGPAGVATLGLRRGAAPRAPSMPRMGATKGFAAGGVGHNGGPPMEDEYVPIVTAGGEVLVDPEIVEAIGNGSEMLGKRTISDSVIKVRKGVIAHLKGLPRPVQ